MNGRKVIITGDDFGMSVEVNEAVEEAHRRGVLTSTSLVVETRNFVLSSNSGTI